MTKENTIMIAEFMCGDLKIDSNGVESIEFIPIGEWKLEEIHYSTSWNWLMPVVALCMGMGVRFLPEDKKDFKKRLTEDVMASNRKSAFMRVVEYIEIYNNTPYNSKK